MVGRTSRRGRKETARAWRVPVADIEANGYSLDLRNPHGPDDLAHRPPAELPAELMETEEEIMRVLCEIEGALAK